MRPTLISPTTRIEPTESRQAVKGEDRAAEAGARTPRRDGQLRLAIGRLRMNLSLWRMRNQLGALQAPLCPEGCGGPRTP
jgi:hypothetical protein